MNLTPKVIWKQVVQFWNKQEKKMKTILTASLLGILAFAIIVTVMLNHINYVVLYRGLSSAEAGEIIARLDEMGVESKIKDDSSILVPDQEEARLKMLLSAEGYPQSALNYDIFSDNSDFMTTDYEKKKYLVFQLQNRLQDAIKTLNGVSNAIVTISISDDSSYVLQENKIPTTASVLLDLTGSTELTRTQITGIEQLVAKSVPGLERENVAIVDDTGTILNDIETDGSLTASNTRMELEDSISGTIKDRIIKLLAPVFGQNRISVAVSTSIELNKKVSEETTYSPVINENGIIAQQDQSREVQNGDLAAEGIPGTETNSEVATYPTQDAETTSGNYSEASSTDYLVNQLTEQVERDGYEIKDISVAVIVGDNSLSKDEIENYREMVAYASGINIDKVLFSGIQFANTNSTVEDNEVSSSWMDMLKGIPAYYLIAAAAIVLILLVLIIILLIKLKKKRKNSRLKISDGGGPDISEMFEEQDAQMPKIVLNKTREQELKKQIKDFSFENPNIVAQLIRAWIKEDEENND